MACKVSMRISEWWNWGSERLSYVGWWVESWDVSPLSHSQTPLCPLPLLFIDLWDLTPSCYVLENAVWVISWRLLSVFWWDWGFKLRASCLQSRYLQSRHSATWTIPLVPFCSGCFWRWGRLWTICPSWPRTMILPISSSQIASIRDVNHQCLRLLY
jgi:hypothetical protein